MPTLPDFTSLGQSPAMRPSPAVGDYPSASIPEFRADTRGISRQQIAMAEESAKAGEAIGRGLQRVSEAGFQLAKDQFQEESQLNNARADAAWMALRVNRLKQYQDDPDFMTAPDRFNAESPDIVANIAQQYIQDPRSRELWLSKANQDISRDFHSIVSEADRKKGNYNSIAAYQSLDNLAETFYLADHDPGMRGEVARAAQNLIDEQLRTGAWTGEQARAAAMRYADKSYKTVISNQDPDTQMSMLGGFEKALIHREDPNGNPATQNRLGFSGLYQFGAPRLETLGVYKPGTNENLKTWNKTTLAESADKWSGTFDIPGYPGVKTIQDFLHNPDAQRKAFQMHIEEIDQQILSKGLDKYIGQTVQGVHITKEGIEAMAHLGGIKGAETVLQGKYWPTDENGTSLISYAKLGLGGKQGDALSTFIDPAERQQMFDAAAKTRWNQQKQEELQTKEQVEQTSGAYLTKIMNNQFDGILDAIKSDPVLSKDPKAQYYLHKAAEQEQEASSKGMAKTYGEGFDQAIKDVSEHKLTEYVDALKLLSEKKLTPSGLQIVKSAMIDIRKDPTTAGVVNTKAHMLAEAKRYLSYEDASDQYSLKDPIGLKIFNERFVPMFEQKFEQWVKDGKDPFDFLKQENVEGMYKGLRSPEQKNKDYLSALNNISNGTVGQSGVISVTAPNGKTYNFKDQASADAFRKQAGL